MLSSYPDINWGKLFPPSLLSRWSEKIGAGRRELLTRAPLSLMAREFQGALWGRSQGPWVCTEPRAGWASLLSLAGRGAPRSAAATRGGR